MDNNAARTGIRKRLFVIIPIALLIVALLVIVSIRGYKNRERLEFRDHLDDTVVTINGEALLYRELSFYVLYIERVTEDQALVYNPKTPKDWWNSYLNGKFVSVTASETALNMAIHDHIMYNLAEQDDTKLDDNDMLMVYYRTCDFWEDLYDIQLDNLPVSKEEINETIRKIAICDKYQQKRAREESVNSFEYDYDGYLYNDYLKDNLEIDIDKRYKKLVFGEITLHHSKVNFVNGLTSEIRESKSQK